MFFTNDVAILTLVPIILNIDRKIKLQKILLISLVTIYANLGSAMMPMGNPQNLYLVSYYHLNLFEFFKLALPIGSVSLLTLLLCSYLFSKKEIPQLQKEKLFIERKHLFLLSLTTIIVLLGVLSIIPLYTALISSVLCTFLINKKVFNKVDYGIVLTFINFFIIVGALGRIPIIHNFISGIMVSNLSVFFVSIGTSQFISNVPTAILLSKFTPYVFPLYLGVTVGGLGTIMASLANLLSLRQYQLNVRDKSIIKFWFIFTMLNFLYLLVFITVGAILFQV